MKPLLKWMDKMPSDKNTSIESAAEATAGNKAADQQKSVEAKASQHVKPVTPRLTMAKALGPGHGCRPTGTN